MVDAMQMLLHADEDDNWAARMEVNVEDLTMMGLQAAHAIGRRSKEMVAAEKERNRARKKAKVLLKRCVSDEQWREFVKKKSFHTLGSDGRTYRVEHQIGGNVTLVVDGQDSKRYCLVPKGHEWIPEPDVMLAVKLMIETNARSFVHRANVMDLRRTG